MATVNKNFKVKHGLVVEGTTGTINGEAILTKSEADIDYIIDQVGGSGVSTNTPNTLVLRDGSGNFAAGTITADLTGQVSDISNHDTDDLSEGTTNKYYSTTQAKVDAAALLTGATQTNISITGDENGLTITAENGVDDSTTDDLDEGTTNKYFTDARARDAVSAGDGLDYNSTSGIFSADLGNGLQIDGTGQIEIDNNVVATQTDLSTDIGTHSDTTSGVHGVTGDVVGTVDAQTLTNKTLGSGTTLSANLDADGFTVTGLPTPSDASDAATKAYVDAVSEGLHIHEAARVAINGNISIATGLENGDTAGGVTLATGDRVLVKDQTTASENGIYVVQASGQALRATDFDTAAEVDSGDFVFVTAGTYANTGWVQTLRPATIGTDALSFTQFSGAGTFTAGNGLTLDGTEFAIDTTVTATKSYVDEEIDAHTELTTAHGVTGTLVGTSDTQTLTNKTLGSGTVLGADLDGTNTYKVVNLVDPTSNQDAATKKYVDDEITSVSGTIDNLTTTDVAEGDNLYFTDIRAKGSAADLIVNAIKTNITITGNEDGLTITAENGVADSTTTDLAEGTNLYFTTGRVDDHLSGGDGIAYSAGVISADLGTGLDIQSGQIQINRTDVDTWYDANGAAAAAQTAAEGYADGLAGNYEVAGAAAAAQTAAESYADGLAVNYDAAGSAAAAESDANSYTDSLIGDVTVDGTSGNTITARIASAVSGLVDSAPELLNTLNELAEALQDNPDVISDLQDLAAGKQDTLTAGANIDITGATISVTGLDTDDVSEGTNLYFTDARAVDALEAVVPNFTEIDVNSVATQVAATAPATAATATTVYSFAKADYRSAKFLVKVASGTHTEISEVLLTLDTSDNVAITEYAIVGTNGTLSAVSAAVSGANVNLLVTPTNTSTVTVMGTLLA